MKEFPDVCFRWFGQLGGFRGSGDLKTSFMFVFCAGRWGRPAEIIYCSGVRGGGAGVCIHDDPWVFVLRFGDRGPRPGRVSLYGEFIAWFGGAFGCTSNTEVKTCVCMFCAGCLLGVHVFRPPPGHLAGPRQPTATSTQQVCIGTQFSNINQHNR